MGVAGRNLQSRVPYDAEVEWISTSAHTACVFLDELSFTHYELKMQIADAGDRQYFGNSEAHGWQQVRTYSQKWRTDGMGIRNIDGVDDCPALVDVDLVIQSPYAGNDYRWIINDQEYLYMMTKGNTITGKIGIFYCYQSSVITSYMGGGKFYYAKVWNGEKLVAELVPVKSHNAGFVYDKISKKMYGSYTMTQLVAGPEKGAL